jgi:ArsR family transcriptional regulator
MIEKCVNDIALAINAEQSLVSHQLKVLKKYDLVAVRKEKNKCFYSLKDGHIKQLLKIALEHIEERNHD